MKVFESAKMVSNCLFLRTAAAEVDPSERKKKLAMPGCIWEEGTYPRFKKDGEWIRGGGRLRAGVSAAVLVRGSDGVTRVILNRFDSGHPTAAGQWSLPSGLWDRSDLDLKGAAIAELGQEVVLYQRQSATCVPWKYNGEVLEAGWLMDYAQDHSMQISDWRSIGIDDFSTTDIYYVYMDNVFQGRALLALEPETGGIEFLFLFQAEIIDQTIVLVDGERFKGQWLNRQVGLYSRGDIEHGLEGGLMTTKVTTILDLSRGIVFRPLSLLVKPILMSSSQRGRTKLKFA